MAARQRNTIDREERRAHGDAIWRCQRGIVRDYRRPPAARLLGEASLKLKIPTGMDDS